MTIVRGPQDLEVTEGDTATFECELSQALADVTWEKVRAQPQHRPRGHSSDHNARHRAHWMDVPSIVLIYTALSP